MDDLVVQGDILLQETLSQLRMGEYRIVFLDPPWQYNDRREIRKDGTTARFGYGAVNHYDCMDLEEIKSIPMKEICSPRCHVYMWATAPLLDWGMEVLKSWGLVYTTIAYTWVKTNPRSWIENKYQTSFIIPPVVELLDDLTVFGTGFYTASNVEIVLLGRYGRPYPHTKGQKASQVIYHERMGHSRKPEDAQDRTTWMYPGVGPCLEVFARRPKVGWDVVGLEVNGGREI